MLFLTFFFHKTRLEMSRRAALTALIAVCKTIRNRKKDDVSAYTMSKIKKLIMDVSEINMSRIGQDSPVHVHHLMSTGTIDEALIDFVHKDRRELSERIMEGGAGGGDKGDTVFSDPVGLFTTLSKLYQEKLKPRFEEVEQVASAETGEVPGATGAVTVRN